MSEDSDINAAAQRLNNALETLVENLDPILNRVSELEEELKLAKEFTQDRSRLAQELDDSRNSLNAMSEKEAKVSELAAKTRLELDSAIADIKNLLAGG